MNPKSLALVAPLDPQRLCAADDDHTIELPDDVVELIERNARLAREAGLIGYSADPITLLRHAIRIT